MKRWTLRYQEWTGRLQVDESALSVLALMGLAFLLQSWESMFKVSLKSVYKPGDHSLPHWDSFAHVLNVHKFKKQDCSCSWGWAASPIPTFGEGGMAMGLLLSSEIGVRGHWHWHGGRACTLGTLRTRAQCLRSIWRDGCLPLVRESGDGCERQNLRFTSQELALEARVGGDHTPSLLDVIEGLLQAELLGLHEVSRADGGRTGDPRLTVDQDFASLSLTQWSLLLLEMGANVSHEDLFAVWVGQAGVSCLQWGCSAGLWWAGWRGPPTSKIKEWEDCNWAALLRRQPRADVEHWIPTTATAGRLRFNLFLWNGFNIYATFRLSWVEGPISAFEEVEPSATLYAEDPTWPGHSLPQKLYYNNIIIYNNI